MSYHIPPNSVKTPSASKLGWLGLACAPFFSPRLFYALSDAFKPEDGWHAWNAPLKTFQEIGASSSFLSTFESWRRKTDLHQLFQTLCTSSISFLLPTDADYPAPFRHCPSPPGPLFWRGDFFSHRFWVSVVGTRRMTTYGRHATQKIVQELCDQGAGIISGMAAGVDGAAHETALKAGAPTIAVLAGGIDDATIYPRMHLTLSRRILQYHGSIFSEAPPGVHGLKHAFPQRNHLIAALSRATLVIEAGERSGSMITALHALEYGRDVFAVPGPITNPMSVGTHTLLKKGAIPCTCGLDILQSVPSSIPPPVSQTPLTAQQKQILDLCRTPILLEDLAQSCDIPISSITSLCMELELCGALQDVGGQRYQTHPAFSVPCP